MQSALKKYVMIVAWGVLFVVCHQEIKGASGKPEKITFSSEGEIQAEEKSTYTRHS